MSDTLESAQRFRPHLLPTDSRPDISEARINPRCSLIQFIAFTSLFVCLGIAGIICLPGLFESRNNNGVKNNPPAFDVNDAQPNP